MHGSLGHLADDLVDGVGRDAASGQADCAIDIGLDHSAAGEGLEGERLRDPVSTDTVDEPAVVAGRAAGEAVEEPMRSLEHAGRSHEPRAAAAMVPKMLVG